MSITFIILGIVIYFIFKPSKKDYSADTNDSNLIRKCDGLHSPYGKYGRTNSFIVQTSYADNASLFYFPMPGDFEVSHNNYNLFFKIKERECLLQDDTVVIKKYITDININNIKISDINVCNSDSTAQAVTTIINMINPESKHNTNLLNDNDCFIVHYLIDMAAAILTFNQLDNQISLDVLLNYQTQNINKYYSTTHNISKKIDVFIEKIYQNVSISSHENKSTFDHIEIYYQILGFNSSNGVSQSDLKTAYRKLSLKYHPDNTDTGDNDQFKLVTNAYDFLLQYLTTK